MQSTTLLKKRWLYVLLGVTGMFFSGASYAWSVFVAPLENSLHLARAETSLAFTLNIFFYAGGIIFAGWLARHLRFSTIMRLGALLLGGGFLLLSQADNIWLIYLAFSLMCGAGSGLAYNSLVSSVPQWFTERAGLITGILLVGYAVSSAVFGPAALAMIGMAGPGGTFTLLGAGCGAVLLALSFFLRVPNAGEKAQLPAPGVASHAVSARDVPTSRMLKTCQFWLLFVILGCFSGVGLIVINHLAPILSEELGLAGAAISVILGAVFCCNALGRLCSGWLLDKMGVSVTLACMAALLLAATVAACGGLYFHAPALVVIGCAACLLTFGANASTIPNAVRALFGQKYFPLNYSMVNANVVWVGFFPTAAGLIQTFYHGYAALFVYLIGVATFTMALVFWLIISLRSFSGSQPVEPASLAGAD